jgi:hypothetical protein
MTVEPFTKNGGLVIFVTVGGRHQPRVRGESVVFGGGLHDPLLNSRILSHAIRLERWFSPTGVISPLHSEHRPGGDQVLQEGKTELLGFVPSGRGPFVSFQPTAFLYAFFNPSAASRLSYFTRPEYAFSHALSLGT